jgi:hypothetical protein
MFDDRRRSRGKVSVSISIHQHPDLVLLQDSSAPETQDSVLVTAPEIRGRTGKCSTRNSTSYG